MKRKIIILCCFVILICGCGKQVMVQNISKEMVYELLDNEDYHIIDVRRLYEYEAGHLKNAILLPLDEIETISEIIPDKNAKIIVYCRTGNRSKQAALLLIEQGYTEVYDMGGMEGFDFDTLKRIS